MLFKKSPERFWNLIASKYASSPITDQAAYAKKIKSIKRYLKPDDKILDMGCGTGTQCCDLAGEVDQVIGIDISSKLLAIADQRRLERQRFNVEFIQTQITDDRFQRESFDVIMAFYVLHFFEDIDATFARIYQLLKPGGLFISETACMGERSSTEGKLMRLFGKLGFLPLINLLTTEQLEQALVRAGFTLVEKVKFSEPRHEYTLFAKKN